MAYIYFSVIKYMHGFTANRQQTAVTQCHPAWFCFLSKGPKLHIALACFKTKGKAVAMAISSEKLLQLSEVSTDAFASE